MTSDPVKIKETRTSSRGVVLKILSRIFLLIGFVLCICILIPLFSYLRDITAPIWLDEAVFSKNPCKLPCWFGITAGESRYDEVSNFLNESPFIPKWAIITETDFLGWQRPFTLESAFLSFKNNTLTRSIFNIPNSTNIQMQDIINSYGMPTATSKQFAYPMDSALERYGLVGVNIYYPELGLVITSRFKYDNSYGETNFTIPDKPMVSKFTLVASSDTLQRFLLQVSSSYTEEFVNDLLEEEIIVMGWPGYGIKVEPELAW